ncbi:hypothetical protein KFL_000720180 [Klebsormidium nitens]|uniref:BTB domain-containing protein n=1 Tax=Klebsormidium nitens TaxID=105231 RepID=A0A1Y1HVC2_KLENI|nr:hypothetical protein KFL_000720180 [Klebsormidium nitens]|eukprot:GAQ81149.1 hypothetical protein KFL_000720180 [Klebsormidium nitens]
MDAATLDPYRVEVELPEPEGSGSDSDEEMDVAAGKKVWYSYGAKLGERPKNGTAKLYRFLIPHAVTAPEKQLESRTMSVGITDLAKRSKEGPLVISIYVKVGVPWTVLQPSVQHAFLRSGRVTQKASLLDETPATGDLSLICKDGSRVPAHAAVLAGIPYFQSKLKNDWSGADWNMHKRLDVHLPCPVDQKVVGAFLRFAYADAAPLRHIEPFEAAALQDLFSLAESTDFTALCGNVKNHVQVTEENATSWLEWLLKEHGPIARKISRKVKRVVKREVKRSFEEEQFWADINDEQLAILNKAAKRRKTVKAPDCS